MNKIVEEQTFIHNKEIEMHRKNSGKIPSLPIIVKTLNPGRKFKKERFGRNVLKPFEAPQKSAKMKIFLNFFS